MWQKLSAALNGQSGISAYGLMREPAGLPGATVRDQAKLWEQASQAAVNAIRANGDGHRLLVSGYRFSNLYNWPDQHPVSWISDPLNNFMYEAHHYWASTHDGNYKSYDQEVAAAAALGY